MNSISRVASFKDVLAFKEYLQTNRIEIPCDSERIDGSASPLGKPLRSGGLHIGNRFAINPMEAGTARPMVRQPS